jgi:hypothetical protein
MVDIDNFANAMVGLAAVGVTASVVKKTMPKFKTQKMVIPKSKHIFNLKGGCKKWKKE